MVASKSRVWQTCRVFLVLCPLLLLLQARAAATSAVPSSACGLCGSGGLDSASAGRVLMACSGCNVPMFCSKRCKREAFATGVVHPVVARLRTVSCKANTSDATTTTLLCGGDKGNNILGHSRGASDFCTSLPSINLGWTPLKPAAAAANMQYIAKDPAADALTVDFTASPVVHTAAVTEGGGGAQDDGKEGEEMETLAFHWPMTSTTLVGSMGPVSFLEPDFETKTRVQVALYHCNKLHHTAKHSNTLLHTAAHRNTLHNTTLTPKTRLQVALQHTATHCNTLQHAATHHNTLLHTATHCNTLQRTATHCNALEYTVTHYCKLPHTATHCHTLLHTVTQCDTLLYTATHCNTLQHTATHYNTLQLDLEAKPPCACEACNACGAVCCSVLQCVAVCSCVLMCCSVLKCTQVMCAGQTNDDLIFLLPARNSAATHCNAL